MDWTPERGVVHGPRLPESGLAIPGGGGTTGFLLGPGRNPLPVSLVETGSGPRWLLGGEEREGVLVPVLEDL